MKRYFIVGTDTDVGKTYVTVALIRYLKQHHRVMGLKPVASGCEEGGGGLTSADACLMDAVQDKIQTTRLPWRLRLPISPHLAARAEGQAILASAVADFCLDTQFNDLDYLLVEGAGGLMVPLNDQETWIDVLLRTQMPVILVVGMRLGCINHALLTASVLKAHGISCVGWIANCLDPNMLALQENIDTLSQFIESPRLAIVPYMGELRVDSDCSIFHS
jgi:dethiobiotin synthetase